MAGYICIKNEQGLSVGGITFSEIAEFSRAYFDDKDKECIKEIYAPTDEGGLSILSLDGLERNCFNAYYKGVRSAYEDYSNKDRCGRLADEYFDMVVTSWKELLELLEADERYEGNKDG